MALVWLKKVGETENENERFQQSKQTQNESTKNMIIVEERNYDLRTFLVSSLKETWAAKNRENDV